MGPVCWAKSVVWGEKDEDDSPDACVKLPLCNPDKDDVICKRHLDPTRFTEKQFNIPHRIIRHSPTGMEWGYGGSGPADFALNILFHFTADKAFAEQWHQKFKFFVAALPQEGGTISGAVIREWIASKKALGDSQLEIDMGEAA